MSDFEQCKRHGLPADWCGPCNAAQEERERIVTLLESIKPYPSGWNYDDPIASVIALIRGES
jgi:hypothetical protein